MVKSAIPPRLDGLLDLACRTGVDTRPTLLRVLTDLYVQKATHSSVEETQYVELALGLIDAVDEPTRATVAARLSAYPSAPLAVLRKLGLVADEDEDDVAAVAPPAPRLGDLTTAFFAADAEERSLILTNLDVAADPQPTRTNPGSAETIRHLETAALTSNATEFARLLERSLGIGPELATRIVSDRSGEPAVVALKAMGVPRAIFQRIAMFLNPAIGHSVERVHALARLYDEITTNAAARMVAIWRAETTRRAAHVPFYWDDERRSARLFSQPAPRRGPRERDEQAWKTGGRSR